MHITFIFNKEKYEVLNFDFTLGTAGRFKDAAAGEIELTLRGDPKAGAFKKLFEFGCDQEANALKAEGQIVVKPAEDKESIETVEFSSCYFSMLSQSISKVDESVYLNAKLRVADVTISKAKFSDEAQAKIIGA
jgi:hypothetical protein